MPDRTTRVSSVNAPVPQVSGVGAPAAGVAGRASAPAVDVNERVRGVANLRRPNAAGGGSAPAIRGAVWLSERAYFAGDGFVVGRRRTKTAAGITSGTAATLALIARELGPKGSEHFSGRGFSSRTRKAMLDHLEPFSLYGRDERARPSLLGIKARAAAYALTTQIAQGMTAASERSARHEVVARLLACVELEPDSGLRRHMMLVLEALPRAALTSTQQSWRRKLQHELLPPTPPYEAWFGDRTRPTLRVKQLLMEGEHFFRDEVAAYRRAGFAIEKTGAGRVAARKTLVDPDGHHPPVRVTVDLEEKSDQVFDALSDPTVDVVFYSGHAQLGGVVSSSLNHGPRQPAADKVIGLFSCRGKQSINAIRRRHPDSQLLVSDQGTFGHDDRIVVQQFYEMVARRSTYEGMRRAIEKEDVWEKHNYILPHDRRALRHLDLDDDGVQDLRGGAPDLLYEPPVAKGRDNSVRFAPSRRQLAPERLNGARVVDAVEWFNTVHFYWSEATGRPKEVRAADQFAAAGWFSSANPEELVRVDERRDAKGKKVFEVRVNAAYGHLSAEALGMLVTFDLTQQMAKRDRPDEPVSTHRLRALAMVASYVACLVEYPDVAELLVRNFAKRFNFPATLSWPVVAAAVEADRDNEASEKVMRALERGMQYPFLEVNPTSSSPKFRSYIGRALELLRRSKAEIGRRTYEVIVSGQVRLDELSDLTRADFLRLRREMLREARAPKVADYERLHVPSVLRAITDGIDGYEWDNRLYVAAGLSPVRLAETLVHEVNHILNASEEHYRSDRAVLREEYRAFYAEALYRGERMSAKRCRELKEEVLSTYLLDRATVDDVPDLPPGVF